jgi:dCMP deaminase
MKENRPSFQDIYMRLALMMAERSTCARLNVGCIITSPDFRYVYGTGYNGSTSGGPNDCDLHGEAAVGACGCLHAEVNAVINCCTPRSSPKIVFCSHLPCKMCAKALVNLGGVQKVFYNMDYRNREGLLWLTQAGIHNEQHIVAITGAGSLEALAR